jgi:hypothetical protein
MSTGSVRKGLDKRQWYVPPECQFGNARDQYAYVQFKLSGKRTACMGWKIPWVDYLGCGTGSWPDQDYTDMQQAVAEQCAQDGQWKSVTVGRWIADFFLGTTALDVREAYTLFIWAQDLRYGKDYQYDTWYLSYGYNFLQVWLEDLLC